MTVRDFLIEKGLLQIAFYEAIAQNQSKEDMESRQSSTNFQTLFVFEDTSQGHTYWWYLGVEYHSWKKEKQLKKESMIVTESMTVKEFLIEEGLYYEAITEACKQGQSFKEIERRQSDYKIGGIFSYSETERGFKFWNELRHKFEEINAPKAPEKKEEESLFNFLYRNNIFMVFVEEFLSSRKVNRQSDKETLDEVAKYLLRALLEPQSTFSHYFTFSQSALGSAFWHKYNAIAQERSSEEECDIIE